MVLGRFPGNGKFFYLRNSLLFSDCNKSKVKLGIYLSEREKIFHTSVFNGNVKVSVLSFYIVLNYTIRHPEKMFLNDNISLGLA